MAVEILILSGARQGERIALDMHEFRVGAEQGCEIFFDPLHDRESKGRSAVFLLTEEGWFIRRTLANFRKYVEAHPPAVAGDAPD